MRSTRLIKRAVCGPALIAAGALAISLVLPHGTAWAEPPTYLMKISAPTLHDVPDTWAANFGAALEKDSGGRIKVQVYPASQLGTIPRQIEGTQFGSIQMEVVPPEFMVGLDPRFEVMAAPGLVDSQAHGQRVAADPAVQKLMLGLGANKGLRGVALFMAEPSVIISRMPLRHLADFKGKKIRIFASPFQSVAFGRLGITPVAMSLGDVVPAIQQGAIDGADLGISPVAHFHMYDAAKYVTDTGQPAIFIIAVINRKWYDSLPKDLQQILDKDAAAQAGAINSFAVEDTKKAAATFIAHGGELIKLPQDEQASMMKTIASVGPEVSKENPKVATAYKIVADAAARTRHAPSQ
ncbi:MAG: TRAP transporter substrate-binding protein [Xanthobacteraceae bacterium]